MQKVDVAIVLVGAAALVATLLGVLTYDDGEHDYSFATTTTDLAPTDPADLAVNGAAVTFEWDALPANATSATVTIEVAWSGNVLPGGDYTATAVVHGRNGTEVTSSPLVLSVSPGPNGAGNGSVSVDISWADVPEDIHGTADDAAARAVNLTGPLSVTVSLEGPNNLLPGQLAFTTKATANVTSFTAVQQLPDAQAAQ